MARLRRVQVTLEDTDLAHYPMMRTRLKNELHDTYYRLTITTQSDVDSQDRPYVVGVAKTFHEDHFEAHVDRIVKYALTEIKEAMQREEKASERKS